MMDPPRGIGKDRQYLDGRLPGKERCFAVVNEEGLNRWDRQSER